MNTKVKKGLMISLRICFWTVVALLIFFAVVFIYHKTYKIPTQAATIENKTGLVQASGRSLYDADGNQLQLRGINAGQVLLQESWMSPFATEPLKNEDGSYVKDKDGNIQYPEFTEEEFRKAIASNPNLNQYDFDELIKIYRDCFWTEEDFRIIKEELKMNTIRFPFYYLDVLNEDLTRKSEEDAFAYLDWFIEMAGKYGLYIVLDLHGAPGGQNGYEHSGFMSKVPGLWESEENVAATVDIWDFVSEHYLHTRPDLGKWIATYDIINEPLYTQNGITTKECHEVFDQIYDVIRENGDAHVITMEGCWGFDTLPDPADYGWENVQYEYHWYNLWSSLLPYEVYYIYQDMLNIGRDYDVPTYIGEFTVFEDKEQWAEQLEMFDERNYSWTIWSYKTTVTGWWTSSWGVYTNQLKFWTEREDVKCNVATCTYEEFVAACETTRTENCVTDTLYEVLTEYNKTRNEK